MNLKYWASIITQKCQRCGAKLRRSEGIYKFRLRHQGKIKVYKFIVCADCGKNNDSWIKEFIKNE